MNFDKGNKSEFGVPDWLGTKFGAIFQEYDNEKDNLNPNSKAKEEMARSVNVQSMDNKAYLHKYVVPTLLKGKKLILTHFPTEKREINIYQFFNFRAQWNVWSKTKKSSGMVSRLVGRK